MATLVSCISGDIVIHNVLVQNSLSLNKLIQDLSPRKLHSGPVTGRLQPDAVSDNLGDFTKCLLRPFIPEKADEIALEITRKAVSLNAMPARYGANVRSGAGRISGSQAVCSLSCKGGIP